MSDPDVERLRLLVKELQDCGYPDEAEIVQEDVELAERLAEKFGGAPAGEISGEALQELAEKAASVPWDETGLSAIGRLGKENDDEKGAT